MRLSITYHAIAASGRGVLVSLSQGGCAFEADATFAIRDPVTLLMDLGFDDPLVGVATVRWIQGSRSGVEFVCMSARSQHCLQEWMGRRQASR